MRWTRGGHRDSTPRPRPEALRHPLGQRRGVPGAAVQHCKRPVRPLLVQGHGGPASEGEAPGAQAGPGLLSRGRLAGGVRAQWQWPAACGLAGRPVAARPVWAPAVGWTTWAVPPFKPMARFWDTGRHSLPGAHTEARRLPCVPGEGACGRQGLCCALTPCPLLLCGERAARARCQRLGHPPGASGGDPGRPCTSRGPRVCSSRARAARQGCGAEPLPPASLPRGRSPRAHAAAPRRAAL